MTDKKRLGRRKSSVTNELKKIIDFTNEISKLVPKKDDTKLSVILNCIAAINKFIPKEDKDHMLKTSGFIIKKDMQFVSMFNSLGLDDIFECEFTSDDKSWDKLLFNKDIGTVIVRSGWETKYDEKYHHSADFDFGLLAKKAWEVSKGHLVVDQETKDRQSYFTYESFKPILGKQFGSSQKKMDDFIESNKSFREKNISRSYLFLGEPGTGKSTMAQRFATVNHEKVLRIGADTLFEISQKDLMSLFDFLHPDCLIVDEIDKCGGYTNWNTGSNILQLLEAIKEGYPEVTMLFTANSILSMPGPLLRPGRIDDIVEFEMPDKNDRKEILLGYLGDMKVENDFLNSIVKDSAGLSPAYVKEIAQIILAGNSSNVNASIKRMVKYLQLHKGNASTESNLAKELRELGLIKGKKAVSQDDEKSDAPVGDTPVAEAAKVEPVSVTVSTKDLEKAAERKISLDDIGNDKLKDLAKQLEACSSITDSINIMSN